MENFCKHVESHLHALNTAEEDDEQSEGKGVQLSFTISACGSFTVEFFETSISLSTCFIY